MPFQTTEATHEVAASIFERMPPGPFPHLVEYARDRVLKPGYTYANEFAFGLELILAGLEQALARERAVKPPH